MLSKIDAGNPIKNTNTTVILGQSVEHTVRGIDEQVDLPDYSTRFLQPNYYNGCGPDCTGT